MKKPLPENEKEYDFFEEFDALSGVVSATECTGLMYKPAENEEEAESYSEICSVPATANNEGKRPKKETENASE